MTACRARGFRPSRAEQRTVCHDEHARGSWVSVSEQLQISGMDVPACAIGTTARAVWAMVAGFRESLETATLLCVSESSSRSRLGPLMECEEVRRRRGKSRLRMPGAERSSESHGMVGHGPCQKPVPCSFGLRPSVVVPSPASASHPSIVTSGCTSPLCQTFVIATKLLRT